MLKLLKILFDVHTLTILALLLCITAIIAYTPRNHDYNNQCIKATCPGYRIVTAPDGEMSCRDLTSEEKFINRQKKGN